MKIKRRITRIKNSIKKAPLSYYVVFSIVIILVYTGVVTVLATLNDTDYSVYYSVFCGIFGGEILMSALIKIFKLKGESENE